MQKHQILRIWCILPRGIGTQKILYSDWEKAFCFITCEAESFKIWGLQRKTENSKVFHFMLLLTKSNDKILWKFKKILFWIYFGLFLHISGKTKKFLENPPKSLFFVSRFPALCKISEKANEQVLRKTGYRCVDVTYGWTETHGQAWIHKTYPAGVHKKLRKDLSVNLKQ